MGHATKCKRNWSRTANLPTGIRGTFRLNDISVMVGIHMFIVEIDDMMMMKILSCFGGIDNVLLFGVQIRSHSLIDHR